MARRGPKPQEQVSIADLFLSMSNDLEAQAAKPNMLGYKPHHKQELFHKMDEFLRLYIGGNRSGKTYGAVAEDIWWASGKHPFIDIKSKWRGEQIRGRVVAVAYVDGVEKIIIPLFKALTPRSWLRGGSWDTAWSARERTLHFEYNDSFIEFMSYEQETAKFAGTSRHFIHYDEEPPKHIFNECQARIIDTNGSSWISMTPVEGMTWMYDDVYQPAEDSEDREVILEGNVDIGPVWRSSSRFFAAIEVGMNENPYITADARDRYLAGLDPDERAARSKGHFVQTAGKVFKQFSVETHVTSEDINPKELQSKGWQIYTSVDHGWNAPTAWLWHAVAPEGYREVHNGVEVFVERVFTFHEHFQSEMTIAEHSEVVKGLEAGWGLNTDDIIRTGDPAMHQHSGITGTTVVQEYAVNGLYIYTDSIPTDRGVGIARMQQYFRVVDNTNRPTWLISDSCQNFIRELRNLRWKASNSKKVRDQQNPQEQVHKKDDHAFDSAKYFATFLQELAPAPYVPIQGKPKGDTMNYDEALAKSLAAQADHGIEWTVVETYS